jgi:hypothetical protein
MTLEEIVLTAELAKKGINLLVAQGNSLERATTIVLSVEPFASNANEIRIYLNK